MKTLNYVTKLTLIALLFVGFTATAQQSSKSLSENIASNEDLSNFKELITAMDASEMLNESESFTVFAPTNNAFSNLSSEKYAQLPKGDGNLKSVVYTHILKGAWTSKQIMDKIEEDGGRTPFETVNGARVIISKNGNGGFMIVDNLGRACNVSEASTKTSNGVLYTIDNVLLPKRF